MHVTEGETEQTAVGPIKPVAGRTVLATKNAAVVANINTADTISTVQATNNVAAVAAINAVDTTTTVQAPDNVAAVANTNTVDTTSTVQATDTAATVANINTADTTSTIQAPQTAAAVANINTVDATNKIAAADNTDEANKAEHYGGWGTYYYPSWGFGSGLGYGGYGNYGHHHHHHHGGFGWRKLLTTTKADKTDTTTVVNTDNAVATTNAPANINNANGGWHSLQGGWDSSFPSGYGSGFTGRGFNRWGTWGRKMLTSDKADTATVGNTINTAAAANAPATINNANAGWDSLGGFGWDGNYPTGYGNIAINGFGGRGFNRWGTWGRKLLAGHTEDLK